MRVLIVDSNIVFAKKVGSFLRGLIEKIEIEYATNVPILQRRLRKNHFDFIIADVMSAFDADGMINTLRMVETPTIVWAVVNSGKEIYEIFSNNNSKRVLPKPASEEAIVQTVSSISSFMLPAVRA